MANTTNGNSKTTPNENKAINAFAIVEIVCAIVLLVLAAVFAFLPEASSFIAPLLGSQASTLIDPHGHAGEWMLIVDAFMVLASLILFGTAMFARDASDGDETGGHSYVVMKLVMAVICLIGAIVLAVMPLPLAGLQIPLIVLLVVVALIDLYLAYTANNLVKQRRKAIGR